MGSNYLVYSIHNLGWFHPDIPQDRDVSVCNF